MLPRRLALRPVTVSLLGLAVVAGLTGCGPDTDIDADAGTSSDTVVEVVDGHTVEVEQGDETVTVTLLGLETPSVDECLGADSIDALEQLLPAGTEVRLESADEGLAAVWVDDVLVNAEIARRGLGFAVAGTAITEQVVAAEEEAVEAAAGLFGADEDCTVPAQVAALEAAGAAAADGAAAVVAGAGLAEVDRHGAALAAAATTGAALAALLDDERSARLPAALVADLRSRTGLVNERVNAVTASVQQVRASEEQRIEAERVAAESAAAQAAADEAARQAQAAADAEAVRVAAEAAAAKAAQKEAPAASAFYKNCDAVRAAGAAPILAGQPGYSSKLDRDGDGIGCEN